MKCWSWDQVSWVYIRLPEKGKSYTHGARSGHQIILMIKWIRTTRFSITNSVCLVRRMGSRVGRRGRRRGVWSSSTCCLPSALRKSLFFLYSADRTLAWLRSTCCLPSSLRKLLFFLCTAYRTLAWFGMCTAACPPPVAPRPGNHSSFCSALIALMFGSE